MESGASGGKGRRRGAPDRITITVHEHAEALREEAYRERISKSEVIRRALETYFSRKGQ